MAPVAGSAYTYAYATLGELMAWIIGWDLVLEYAMSCATVAAAWTKYFNEFLPGAFGLGGPGPWCNAVYQRSDGVMNLPAVLIVASSRYPGLGIRESASFNALMVAIKLGVVLFVIAVGYRYVEQAKLDEQSRRKPAASRKIRHPGAAK